MNTAKIEALSAPLDRLGKYSRDTKFFAQTFESTCEINRRSEYGEVESF